MVQEIVHLDERTSPKAKEATKKGIASLRSEFFKQATLEFSKALAEDRAHSLINLRKILRFNMEHNETQQVETVGKILLEQDKEDIELANMLGNFARKNKNYQQANDHYRYCLKINKNYDKAVFNLGASLAEVEMYDLEIKKAIAEYANFPHYILPDPLKIQETEDELSPFDLVAAVGRDMKERRLETLRELKEKALEKQDAEKVKRLTLQIKEEFEKDLPEIPGGDRFEKIVEEILFKRWDGLGDTERKSMVVPLYNAVLRGLEADDEELTDYAIKRLNEMKVEPGYFTMCKNLFLAKKGKLDHAISGMNQLVQQFPDNRFYNVNLGLMYKKSGNKLAACRYLVKGASIIQKLEGYYQCSDILILADKYQRQGELKSALNLYQRVAKEVDDVNVWGKFGNLCLKLERYSEAKENYDQVLRLNPKSSLVKKKLKEIHDHFFKIAEELAENNQNRKAAEYYERALEFLRPSATLKKASDLFKFLNDSKKSFGYLYEYREAIEKEKEVQMEQQRLNLIQEGKRCLKAKDFNLAINKFQEAFRMKLDKDVLMYLAHIYKALNRHQALNQLLVTWKKMNDIEEKRAKYETQQA